MDKHWSTVVTPNTGMFDIPVNEIIQYRGLIWTLVKRNYQVQYKQTIMGPFWLVFGLIINTGVFSLIFGYIGNFSSDGSPYFLFYMTGAIIWGFFSDCFHANANVLLEYNFLFSKVYFPRLIVPVSNYLFNLIRTGIKLIVLFVTWGICKYLGMANVDYWGLLFLVPAILIAGVMGTAGGLLIASSTVKYRDFAHLTGAMMTFLMYCSPVIYSINQLPGWLQNFVLVNPISSLVEVFRVGLTGIGIIHWWALLYSVLFTIVLMIIAVLTFNQTEKDFIDII